MTCLPPDLARTALPGHDLRHQPGRVDAAVWGVICLVAAIVPALIALGIIPVPRGNARMLFPHTSLAFVACWCLLACYLFWKASRRPSGPAPRHKPRDAAARSAARAGLLGFVFLLPLNYVVIGIFSHIPARDLWTLLIPSPGWLFALPDLIVFLILGNAVYLHLRYRKFGPSNCTFAGVPHLGRQLVATFSCARPLGHCRTLTFTLRCVEEVVEYRPAGRNSSSRHTTVYQLWGQTIRYENETFDIPGQRFQLSFELPSADVILQAVTGAPRFWELEATADVPGINFNALFPVAVDEGLELSPSSAS